MADITNLSGVISTLGIFYNDGTTEAPDWVYFCAINARAFNQTVGETTTDIVASCGPGAPVETWRAAGAKDWSITGTASLELSSYAEAQAWLGETREVQIRMFTGDKNDLTIHSFYQGPGILNQLNISQADANGIPQAEISIVKGAGSLTYTVGAPSP